MAASISFTNYFKTRTLYGDYDWDNDTIKAMLVSSSYTPDLDAHDFANDVNTYEVNTSGSYTKGFGNRITLTTTLTQDNTDNEGVVDVTDWSATAATITARYVVYIKEVTSDADSPILAIEDLGADKTSTAGTWSYTTNTEGLINLG